MRAFLFFVLGRHEATSGVTGNAVAYVASPGIMRCLS